HFSAGAKKAPKSHGSAALQIPLRISPLIKIQVSWRTLVSAADVNQVSQVNGTPRRRGPDNDVADRLCRFESPGCIKDDVFLATDLKRSSRKRYVACLQQILQF